MPGKKCKEGKLEKVIMPKHEYVCAKCGLPAKKKKKLCKPQKKTSLE